MLDLVIVGITSGIAYAALGICLTLTHQVSNLINVSQALVGSVGGYAFVSFYEPGSSLVVPMVLGVLVGAGLAALQGVAFAWWFARADSATRTAASIAMTITVLAAGQRFFGDDPQLFPLLMPGSRVQLGHVNVATVNLLALGLLVLVVLTLRIALQRTRSGLRLRTVSLMPGTAELLGVRTRLVIPVVWALAGGLATLGLLVVMPTRQADLPSVTLLVVPALAAALLGSMRHFERVLVAGLGIGVIEAVLLHWPSVAGYRQAVSFLVIVAALLIGQRSAVWHEAR